MIWNVLHLICYIAGKCYEIVVGLSVSPCRDITYTKQALSLKARCLDSAGILCESLRGIAEVLQTNLGGDEVCLRRWPFPNLKWARICSLRTSLSAQSQPWSYTSFRSKNDERNLFLWIKKDCTSYSYCGLLIVWQFPTRLWRPGFISEP